jgi:hypothetical protein
MTPQQEDGLLSDLAELDRYIRETAREALDKQYIAWLLARALKRVA